MAKWNSDIYLKFRAERGQPSLDLISRLNKNYKNILDLGCGPGNSTANLIKKFSEAKVLGIDADENMLQKALKEHPELKFEKAFLPQDFERFGKFDLIFSNACIQWISEQKELIEKTADHITLGGTFAVQVPMTDESQFYSKILKTLLQKSEYENLRKIHNFYALDEYGYYNLLSRYFSRVEIWKTDYHHIVDSAEDIVSWYEGSGLRPYLAELSEEKKEEFKSELVELIKKEYTRLEDGKYFLVMPRLFFIAEK